MNKELLKKLSLNLKSNKENWMECFRNNVQMYVDEKEIRMSDIANEADISVKTLDNFLHNKTKDCNLSTAVALARSLEVSLDELVGAETVKPEARVSMPIYRNLQPSDQYLVRWFVNYLMSLSCEEENKSLYRSVMDIECMNGALKLNSLYHRANISEVPAEMRTRIFFGIKMPCDHYMPVYSPYETLLIANDRLPMHNENCLIRVKKNVYIAKVKMENGEMKFYSIRDGKFRLNRDEVDEVVGYIATTIIEKE